MKYRKEKYVLNLKFHWGIIYGIFLSQIEAGVEEDILEFCREAFYFFKKQKMHVLENQNKMKNKYITFNPWFYYLIFMYDAFMFCWNSNRFGK